MSVSIPRDIAAYLRGWADDQYHPSDRRYGFSSLSAAERRKLIEAASEIERLRAINRQMAAELTRTVASMDIFIAEHTDPGAEALSAVWCAKQTLRNLAVNETPHNEGDN